MILQNTNRHIKIHNDLLRQYLYRLNIQYDFEYASLSIEESIGNHQVLELLQRNYGMTAISVRTRSDIILLHRKRQNISLLLEFKAKQLLEKYIDDPKMMIEISPLVDHIIASRDGIICLYVFVFYDNPIERKVLIEKAFWSHDVSKEGKFKISTVNLGNNKKYSKEDIEIIYNKCRRELGEFPNGPSYDWSPISNGSEDPYGNIINREISKMSHMDTLVKEFIDSQ